MQRVLRRQQSGAALLAALLILALCATLITFLMLSQRLLIHQAILVTTSDRMTIALQNVQNWAQLVLDTQQDIHHVKAYRQVTNGIQTSGMIYALGGRFNINALQVPANVAHFNLLLAALEPNMSQQQINAISLAIQQWMSPQNIGNNYYLGLKPAYLPAHGPIVNLSELRLVKGITPALYARLVLGKQPYLTAWPNTTYVVNVNYASVPMFMSIGGITTAAATAMVRCRNTAGAFVSVVDFMQHCAANTNLNATFLTTNNTFYLVRGRAQQGEQHLSMQALLQVNSVNSKPVATLLWQEFNGD